MAYLQQIKGDIEKEIQEKGVERSQIKNIGRLDQIEAGMLPSRLCFIENYEGESGKFLLLDEIISEAVDSGHRLLLFFPVYRHAPADSRQVFPPAELTACILTANTPAEERGYLVNSFNEGTGKVFLPVAESRRHRPEPYRGGYGHTLRPLVESGRRGSGHRPYLPHRSEEIGACYEAGDKKGQ